MSWYELSGFADEVSPMLDEQMDAFDDFGIKYIEMRKVDGKNISKLTEDEAREIKKRMDGRGFRVSALGSPLGKIDITEDFPDHLEIFRHTLEIADILEAKYIRLFSFYIPEGQNPAEYKDEVFKRLRCFKEEARGSGITLLHENEKGIYGGNADRCFQIMEELSDEHFRFTFDPANFVQVGEETFPNAYGLLRPFIEYMHIKDARREDGIVVPSGMGDGNVPLILKALKESGYQGFLSLEPHLGKFKGLNELERGKTASNISQSQSGKELFGLAVNSLKEILDKI